MNGSNFIFSTPGREKIIIVKGIKVIEKQEFVSDIVKRDYRTAHRIFRRHGIEFCCGAKFPLELVCSLKGLDLQTIQAELELQPGRLPYPNTLNLKTGISLSWLIILYIFITHI